MKRYYPLTNGTAFMGMRAEDPYDEWGPREAYFLASDIDRLRTEGRERLMLKCGYGGKEADRIISAFFGEEA